MTHQVMIDNYMDLTERVYIVPEEFIKKSFEFLLDREPKDSTLQHFDITQINGYFPEIGKEVKRTLEL